MFEAYANALDLGFPAEQDPANNLISAASATVKEVGEAVSAALDAAAHSEDPSLLAIACKEVGEGMAALHTLSIELQRGHR